jgi:SAM-dependent methyltransferase
VDLVYLSAVFHWVPDKERALAEINRVLKPGGRIGLTTNAKELAHATTLRSVTTRVLGRELYRDQVNAEDFAPTRLGVTTTQLLELILDSGLSLADFHIRSSRRNYASGKDILNFAESSTFGNYLHHVPAALRDRARADLEAEFELLRDHAGISFQGYTLFAVAAKPGAHLN